MKESVEIVTGIKLFAENYQALGYITNHDGTIQTVIQRRPEGKAAQYPPADMVIFKQQLGAYTHDTVYEQVSSCFGISPTQEDVLYRSYKTAIQPGVRAMKQRQTAETAVIKNDKLISKARLTDPKLAFTKLTLSKNM
jgi:hypothetical protein